MEVASVSSIRKAGRNLYVQTPLLFARGIFSEGMTLDERSRSLAKTLSRGPLPGSPRDDGVSLPQMLLTVCEDAMNPKSTVGLERYRLHTAMLSDALNDGALDGFLPIFTNGLSPASPTNLSKRSHDPYSNLCFFTTQLLAFMPPYDEVLRSTIFAPVQPVAFFPRFIWRDDKRGIEDLLKDRIEHLDISGMGFGTLTKFDDITAKIGNSSYHPKLLDPVLSENDVRRLSLDPCSMEREIRLARGMAHINTHLLAIKYAHILDSMADTLVPRLREMQLPGIPLYMEKTSRSATVMLASAGYLRDARYSLFENPGTGPFFFIGDGILSTTPEKFPMGGICHPSALARLIGFFGAVSQERLPTEIPEKNVLRTIRYHSLPGPKEMMLLEEGTENQHPNLHDLADELILRERNQNSPSPVLDDRTMSVLRRFGALRQAGFSRIEPRIVELLTVDSNMYMGLRNRDMTNRRWLAELYDKRVVFPKQIPGFSSLLFEGEVTSEFRGSELSLSTTPHITSRWYDHYFAGNLDAGCSLDKINHSDTPFRAHLLRSQLDVVSEEERVAFFETHDERLRSKSAMIGTAIHALGSEPLEGLVHYETLRLAGLDPVVSSEYCELSFCAPLLFNGVQFTASFHPDAMLFFERTEGEYDLLVFDTKTNRVTPSPEHKYLQQTLFYGIAIEQLLESLGARVHNIYTVLNKNPFYGEIPSSLPVSGGFRSQQFSPITCFAPDDSLRLALPDIVSRAVLEKRSLRSGKEDLLQYKSVQREMGRCESCFLDRRLVCDAMESRYRKGWLPGT